MEQKTLSKWLKCVVVGIGICGLVILALLIPSSEYIEHFWHWLFFIFASSIPCYIALFLGWKIATNIGNNRSFSEANARLLKGISILFAADAIFFLVGNIFLFLINSSNFEVLLVCSMKIKRQSTNETIFLKGNDALLLIRHTGELNQ